MHYNSKIKKLFMCLLISSFLFFTFFIMAAEKDKFKYHSQLSVLDFYLIRLYDIEKCGTPKKTYIKNISWCLKEFPKVNKSNIELHFIIYKNSSLDSNLIKATSAERRQLILNGIDDFINYYWHNIGIYYETNFNKQELIGEAQLKKEIILMNQEIKEEENLDKLMDLYFHYCVDDKCYIKKDKIKMMKESEKKALADENGILKFMLKYGFKYFADECTAFFGHIDIPRSMEVSLEAGFKATKYEYLVANFHKPISRWKKVRLINALHKVGPF